MRKISLILGILIILVTLTIWYFTVTETNICKGVFCSSTGLFYTNALNFILLIGIVCFFYGLFAKGGTKYVIDKNFDDKAKKSTVRNLTIYAIVSTIIVLALIFVLSKSSIFTNPLLFVVASIIVVIIMFYGYYLRRKYIYSKIKVKNAS